MEPLMPKTDSHQKPTVRRPTTKTKIALPPLKTLTSKPPHSRARARGEETRRERGGGTTLRVF